MAGNATILGFRYLLKAHQITAQIFDAIRHCWNCDSSRSRLAEFLTTGEERVVGDSWTGVSAIPQVR